jgi:hypothetical protein
MENPDKLKEKNDKIHKYLEDNLIRETELYNVEIQKLKELIKDIIANEISNSYTNIV